MERKIKTKLQEEKTQSLSFEMHIQWEETSERNPKWNKRLYNDMERNRNDDMYEDDFPISYLKNTIVGIMPQMKDELNKFADNAIKEIRVDSFYDGSVIALLTVIWDTAKTVKDAYDIAKMIREVSQLFMKSKLKEKLKDDFYVNSYVLNFDDKKYKNQKHPTQAEKVVLKKRDGFFYYLLAANIAQALIIGALVFKAVMKVYFGV